MTDLETIRAYLATRGHGTADSAPALHSHEDAIMRDEMGAVGVACAPDDVPRMARFARDYLAEVAALAAKAEEEAQKLIPKPQKPKKKRA